MAVLQIFNCLSVVAAFIAAVLWFWSSVAKVESDYKEEVPEGLKFVNFHGGRCPIKIENNGKRIDVVGSLDLQSRINSCAACFAGMAAIFQAIVLGFPSA